MYWSQYSYGQAIFYGQTSTKVMFQHESQAENVLVFRNYYVL